MKKAILVLLCFIMLCGASSCNSSNSLESDNPEESLYIKENDSSIIEKFEKTSCESFENYESIIKLYSHVTEIVQYDHHQSDIVNTLGFDRKPEIEQVWLKKLYSSVSQFCPPKNDASLNIGKNHFAYVIVDVNQDGIDELICITNDRKIVAIFSKANDLPFLVESFSNRYICKIAVNGLIYTLGSSGAAHTTNRICQISTQHKSLITIEEFGTDGYNPTTLETKYYILENEKRTPISEQEYIAFVHTMPYEMFENVEQLYFTSCPLNHN